MHVCLTSCFMPWHGHSNSVTQTEALKNLLHLGAMFFMPSSLPFLHTAMPTPCLNTFSHSDAYIIWKCFLSQLEFISVDIFLDVAIGPVTGPIMPTGIKLVPSPNPNPGPC